MNYILHPSNEINFTSDHSLAGFCKEARTGSKVHKNKTKYIEKLVLFIAKFINGLI